MYTPTRTPPRRDALQAAVDAADKGSEIRRRAAEMLKRIVRTSRDRRRSKGQEIKELCLAMLQMKQKHIFPLLFIFLIKF